MDKSYWNPYPKYLNENVRYAYSYAGGRPLVVQLVKVTEKGYNLKVLRPTKKYGVGQLLCKKHLYPAKHYVQKFDEMLFFFHNGSSSVFTELSSENLIDKFATTLKVAHLSLEPRLTNLERVRTMQTIIVKLNHKYDTNFKIQVQLDDNDSIEYDFDLHDADTFLLNQHMTSLSR